MKLETKHLAPYLPYNLKCEVLNSGPEKEIGEMIAVYNDDSACFGNIVEPEKGFEYIKLILHPLSDLTKEIDHNGEKFVPIEKLRFSTQEKMLLKAWGSESGRLTYNQSQKLFEWHFDIFGLIEKGLAIDINTLSVQNDG